MTTVTVTARRTMPVPAPIVHACIADYARHHRPEGFLPPAFTRLEVLEGGVGAGTRIRFAARMGGAERSMDATISEPEPGRVLVETGPDVVSTFTVEPTAGGTRVTITSDVEVRGLSGLLTRWLVPRILGPLYADELARLESYAGRLAVASAVPEPAIASGAAA